MEERDNIDADEAPLLIESHKVPEAKAKDHNVAKTAHVPKKVPITIVTGW